MHFNYTSVYNFNNMIDNIFILQNPFINNKYQQEWFNFFLQKYK